MRILFLILILFSSNCFAGVFELLIGYPIEDSRYDYVYIVNPEVVSVRIKILDNEITELELIALVPRRSSDLPSTQTNLAAMLDPKFIIKFTVSSKVLLVDTRIKIPLTMMDSNHINYRIRGLKKDGAVITEDFRLKVRFANNCML